jgi:hypothetical protein
MWEYLTTFYGPINQSQTFKHNRDAQLESLSLPVIDETRDEIFTRECAPSYKHVVIELRRYADEMVQ